MKRTKQWLIVGLILLLSIISIVFIIHIISKDSKPQVSNLIISDVYVSNITSNSATIDWKTNKKSNNIVWFRSYKFIKYPIPLRTIPETYLNSIWTHFQLKIFTGDDNENKLRLISKFSSTTTHSIILNNLESEKLYLFAINVEPNTSFTKFVRDGKASKNFYFITKENQK